MQCDKRDEDGLHYRSSDPATSREAWEKTKPSVETQKRRIMEELSKVDDLTAGEVADRLGFRRDQISPRFKSLRSDGSVELVTGPDGKPLTRNGANRYRRVRR